MAEVSLSSLRVTEIRRSLDAMSHKQLHAPSLSIRAKSNACRTAHNTISHNRHEPSDTLHISHIYSHCLLSAYLSRRDLWVIGRFSGRIRTPITYLGLVEFSTLAAQKTIW